MQLLLRELASSSDKAKLRKYAEHLLQGSSSITVGLSHSQLAVRGLSEPLSARELEVLQLIGQGMSNREIADKLVISLRTVKKHVENIYGKLDVKNRSQAILRAQELELI